MGRGRGGAVALLLFVGMVPVFLLVLLFAPTIQPAPTPADTGDQICGTGKLTIPDKAKPWIAEAAKTSGLPGGFIAAIADQESGFNPTAFAGDSNGGTWGLFQLNRSIWHGVYPQGDNAGGTPKGITDPMIHAQYGGVYLKQMLATVTAMQKSHPTAAYAKIPALDALVIAHNAGEGNLEQYPKIPTSTKSYLSNIHSMFTGVACEPGSSGQTGKDDYSAFQKAAGFTPGDPAYVVDPYSFYYGECTGYAAFAVAHYSKYHDFKNDWTHNGKTAHFGDAGTWGAAARAVGIEVNGTPAVGAVAESLTDGSVGHVAYVTAVHPDGSFDINEANYAHHHAFGSRTNLRPGVEFQNFLHFEK